MEKDKREQEWMPNSKKNGPDDKSLKRLKEKRKKANSNGFKI